MLLILKRSIVGEDSYIHLSRLRRLPGTIPPPRDRVYQVNPALLTVGSVGYLLEPYSKPFFLFVRFTFVIYRDCRDLYCVFIVVGQPAKSRRVALLHSAGRHPSRIRRSFR